MTNVGETISADQFKQQYGVGQTISADQFNSAYGQHTPTTTSQPAPKQNVGQRIAGAGNSVGNFLGFGPAGQGLSTVGSSIPDQVINQTVQDTKSTQAVYNKLHQLIQQGVPANDLRRLQLVNYLKRVSTQPATTAADINPAYNLSTKQVLGSFANVGLTAATAGLGTPETTLGKAAAGAATGYAFDKAQQATNNEQITASPGAGTIVGALLPFAGKLVSEVSKSALGVTTGAGKDVIQRAIDNPETVFNAIKSSTPETKTALIDTAKQALNSFLQERSNQFGEGLSQLVSTEPISKQTVLDSFAKQVGKFGGQVDNGVLKFGDTALNSTEQNAVKDVFKTIKSWKNVTPQGMETLRQRIGNEISNFKFANNGRDSVILGGVKTDLTNLMKSKISGYSEMLSKYGNQTDAARALSKELSLSGTAKPTTQLKQIMNIFKKDPSVMKNLETVMGKSEANKFLNEVSGSILSEWLPPHAQARGIGEAALTGLAHLGGAAINPATIVGGAAVQSPKVVGTAATLAGRAVKAGITKGLNKAAIIGASKIKK